MVKSSCSNRLRIDPPHRKYSRKNFGTVCKLGRLELEKSLALDHSEFAVHMRRSSRFPIYKYCQKDTNHEHYSCMPVCSLPAVTVANFDVEAIDKDRFVSSLLLVFAVSRKSKIKLSVFMTKVQNALNQ